MSGPTTVFILPGWLDSGPGHWQSLWASSLGDAWNVVRVEQHDWQRPLRGDWCARLDDMVANHLASQACGDGDQPTSDAQGRVQLPELAAVSSGTLLNKEQTIEYPRRKSARFSSKEPPRIILAAHSLGCHLVAAWAAASRHTAAIQGALLVAPPDVNQADLPPEMTNWRSPVLRPLPFAATCAVSSNDPFCSLAAGQAMAQAWGARCVDAGALGHINTDSGIGAWPAGQALLRALAANNTLHSTHI